MGKLAFFVVSLALADQSWGNQQLSLQQIFGPEPLEGKPAKVVFAPDGSGLYVLKKQDRDMLLIKEDWEGRSQVQILESQLQLPEDPQIKLSLKGFQVSPHARLLLLNDGKDLFLVELAAKKVRRLTTSPEPEELAAFSPNGAWVSFIRKNNLYVVDLAKEVEQQLSFDGSETKLNGVLDWVYTEELYNRNPRGYVWSPDSQHILYLSFQTEGLPRYPLVDLLQRHPQVSWLAYPKAGDANAQVTVNVVALTPQASPKFETLRMSFSGPHREYVARFGWLPEGQSFWVLFLSRDQKNSELVTFQLPLGSATVVLQEQDDAWLNVEDDLLWHKNSLVFGSERSGFRHLYRLDLPSKEVRPLTTGDFQITSLPCLDEKSEYLYFQAAHPTPLERHLFRVSLAGGPMERLTKEPGTHILRAAPNCQVFLDRYSRATLLPQTRLLDRNGNIKRVIPYEQEPKLDLSQLGTTSFLDIPGPSGQKLYASLLTPRDFNPQRRYPVVIYVYGGPHAQVVRDGWGGRTALFHHFLAQQGFLVFSLDNRGATARGRDFERALYRRLGEVELADQLAGVRWLTQQPYVDAARLGIWGWSYGGFMTLYALTHSKAFRAGVAVAPVTDWRLYDTIYTERYLKLPQENEKGYRDSSPVWQAENLSAPVLIVHGTGDDNVHWQNTLTFIQALVKAEKPYQLFLYPNKNHGIPGLPEQLHLFTAIYNHFRQHLCQEQAPLQ